MSSLEVRETIEAPVEAVFARATDLANAAQVIEGIHKLEILTDGPVGLGTRFRETRTMFGREATEVMEITVWEPPHRYAVDAGSHGCEYHTSFDFTPVGSATEILMRFQAKPITFLAKVMTVLTKPMLKSMAKLCAKDLADVKRAVEGEAA